MPYYYRRRRYPKRRRYWRRRFRGPFRSRFWRRRKRFNYRVRRKKLSKIKLVEWQPKYIHKLKITGKLPLFITTSERISNDYAYYSTTVVPHFFPGGGGFSIYKFTLDALYEQHLLAQNYWTKSNVDMPFIRYTGCKFKLFRNENSDYIVNYHACSPMVSTADTFHSTQPLIMLNNTRHKIVQCKKNNKYRKPYKVIRMTPPTNITNKWYLQKEFASQPLALLMSSAMSLDRFYASATAQSTTIGFQSLNTNVFNLYNYKLFPTTGYTPNKSKYYFGLQNGTTSVSNSPIWDIIYLGNSKEISKGKTIRSTLTTSTDQYSKQNFLNYFKTTANWGNIFEPTYLTQEVRVLVSNYSPTHIAERITNWNQNTQIGDNMTETSHKLLIDCRYNPHADTGNNVIFLLKTTLPEQIELHVPDDPKYKSETYPLWLSSWGFLDYERRTLGNTIDTDTQAVIKSEHINPTMEYYIPIDEEFTTGRSKYRPINTPPTTYDALHWHPKLSFQVTSINNICSSGPATIKLPKNISAEAHCQYSFYFKLGSCGPPMQTVENPDNIHNITDPNNILQTTSLQNPTYPPEYYLYKFDERRGQITPRAAERLQTFYESEKDFSKITGISRLCSTVPAQKTQTTTQEEAEEETLLELLRQQRMQQQEFKLRILNLIKNTQ